MFKKIVRYSRGKIKALLGFIEKKAVVGNYKDFSRLLDRNQWVQSLSEPDEFYKAATAYFEHGLSPELRRHRRFFQSESRGFGEDAFHTLWFLLCREFRIDKFLEIGVYRGQTLSLVSLLQKEFSSQGTVTGVSPFLPAGDEVSKYLSGIDYLRDTLENFEHFGLPAPTLIKAFSTDPEAIKMISSESWDCIYIDGNHDYEIALSDWRVCSGAVRPGGLVVLDDSGLNTNYRAPRFATAGHPGPSILAAEICTNEPKFVEILQIGHNRVFQKRKA